MMQVECTKLFIIFLIIMGSVLLKRSLNETVFLAIASTVLLFRIPINQTLSLSVHSVFEKDTLIVLGSYFYYISSKNYGKIKSTQKSGNFFGTDKRES